MTNKFQSGIKGTVIWRTNCLVKAVIIRVNKWSLTVVLLEDISDSAFEQGDIVNIGFSQFKKRE